MRTSFARFSSMFSVIALSLALGACSDSLLTAPSPGKSDETPSAPCQDAGCPITHDTPLNAPEYVGRIEDAASAISSVAWSGKERDAAIAALDAVKAALLHDGGPDVEAAQVALGRALEGIRNELLRRDGHAAHVLSTALTKLEEVASALGVDDP